MSPRSGIDRTCLFVMVAVGIIIWRLANSNVLVRGNHIPHVIFQKRPQVFGAGLRGAGPCTWPPWFH
jgi:hypothetical protein